jgi:hypothetical protein
VSDKQRFHECKDCHQVWRGAGDCPNCFLSAINRDREEQERLAKKYAEQEAKK